MSVRRNMHLLLGLTTLLASCSSVLEVDETQKFKGSAEAPYQKILVVALFDSFDARRYLETEIVDALAKEGTAAVRSTSMMKSTTPIVRQTFIDMIDEIGADALLLTQLTAIKVDATEQDVRPQATYNYWPTYYWNVWSVELTEYVEPPRTLLDHDIVLATQAFSVAEQAPVWGIETRSQFTEIEEEGLDYQVFVDEANAVVRNMKRTGLIGK